jgi:hypothetical protein
VPPLDQTKLPLLRETAAMMAAEIVDKVGPIGLLDDAETFSWTQRYGGSKAARYAAAWEEAFFGVARWVKKTTKAFVKREVAGDLDGKVPRIIQSQPDELNVTVGPYILRVQERLHLLEAGTSACGLDPIEMGQAYTEMVAHGEVYGVDCTKWDAHMTNELQEIELEFYTMLGVPRHIVDILRMRMQVLGQCGPFTYQITRGARESGTVQTSAGNTFLNLAIARTYFCQYNLTGKVLAMGDDMIFSATERDGSPICEDTARAIAQVYEWFGLRPKFTTSHSFCSSIFVRAAVTLKGVTRLQYVLVPDGRRLLQRFGLVVGPARGWVMKLENSTIYLGAKATSFTLTRRLDPVFGPFFQRIAALGAGLPKAFAFRSVEVPFVEATKETLTDYLSEYGFSEELAEDVRASMRRLSALPCYLGGPFWRRVFGC